MDQARLADLTVVVAVLVVGGTRISQFLSTDFSASSVEPIGFLFSIAFTEKLFCYYEERHSYK